MGGYNSGRSGGRPTIEATACYVLSARVLRKIKVPPGHHATVESAITLTDGFRIAFTLKASCGELLFTFRHPIRAEDERETSYTVRAMAAPVRLGGQRWWWVCPLTGRRVFKLYLPLGGWQFWSRQGYRLGYACQRETKADRRMRRARRLHRALGGDGEALGGELPPKPKGMRWRTYDRKIAEWFAADGQAEEAWTAAVLARFPEIARRLRGSGDS